jgi:purine catabolism regulator
MVRWVHSSEIYGIAPLLRGGELLLTTGLGLVQSSAEERREYVRSLAARHVAGLALELAESFSEAPDDMVDEARRLGLPFIALRTRYPFVEVTEQVNSAILDSSIVRLRHADEVGRALSRVLAEQGGLDALTATLADVVGRPVVVTDTDGHVLAAAPDDAPAVLLAPAATAVIVADGILLGSLVIGEPLAPETGAEGDRGEVWRAVDGSADDLLQAVQERAPEVFAIELLRQHQLLLTGRQRSELLGGLLVGRSEEPGALAAHAAALGLGSDTRWAGLALQAADGRAGLVAVHEVSRRAGVRVLAAELDGMACALLALPGGSAAAAAERVRGALDRAEAPRVALGPVVDRASAGRSLRTARQTLGLEALAPHGQRVLVCDELVAERLLSAVPDRDLLTDIVDEQLSSLLGARNAETLLATLEHYLASGCSKAATARALHLRRQSVHQRLVRLTSCLGHDLSDPRRQTALRLALVAHRALTSEPGVGEIASR